MQEQTASRGPSLLTASPDGRPGPLAPEPDAGRAGLRPSPAEAPPRASLCSRKPLLPPGLACGLERPAVLLVGRAVPAGAGAPPVEAHAADPGALRRVRARGEAGGARPALRPAPPAAPSAGAGFTRAVTARGQHSVASGSPTPTRSVRRLQVKMKILMKMTRSKNVCVLIVSIWKVKSHAVVEVKG